jgi:hypothetical protein
MSVPRLRRRHPREIVVLHAFGELVCVGLVAGARASPFVLRALAFDPSNVVKDATSQRSGEQDRDHASGRAGKPPRGDKWFGTFDRVAEKIPDRSFLADGGWHHCMS